MGDAWAAVGLLSMLGVSVASGLMSVPVWLQMMLLVLPVIYIGSLLSLNAEKDQVEHLQSKDAMLAPIFGSIALVSLFFVYKFFPAEYVNLVARVYFVLFGELTMVSCFEKITLSFVDENLRKGLSVPLFQFTIPKIPFIVEKEEVVKVTKLGLVFHVVAAPIAAAYWTYNKWFLNNVFGISFSLSAIEQINIGSYYNGSIMLIGLFFYDIFWVFGTEVMVKVATSFDAPIKLLFPRGPDVRPSLLGLGDIVIPGFFIALMLKFDAHLALSSKNQHKNSFSRVYFLTVSIAYVIGLSVTLAVMFFFKKAQPALLYLSPACLLSVSLLACIRGQWNELLKFHTNPSELVEATSTTSMSDEATQHAKKLN